MSNLINNNVKRWTRKAKKLSFDLKRPKSKTEKLVPESPIRRLNKPFFFQNAQNENAADFNHLFILVTRGVILHRTCVVCDSIAHVSQEIVLRNLHTDRTRITTRRKTGTRKKGRKHNSNHIKWLHLTGSYIWWHNSSAKWTSTRTRRNVKYSHSQSFVSKNVKSTAKCDFWRMEKWNGFKFMRSLTIFLLLFFDISDGYALKWHIFFCHFLSLFPFYHRLRSNSIPINNRHFGFGKLPRWCQCTKFLLYWMEPT